MKKTFWGSVCIASEFGWQSFYNLLYIIIFVRFIKSFISSVILLSWSMTNSVYILEKALKSEHALGFNLYIRSWIANLQFYVFILSEYVVRIRGVVDLKMHDVIKDFRVVRKSDFHLYPVTHSKWMFYIKRVVYINKAMHANKWIWIFKKIHIWLDLDLDKTCPQCYKINT